MSRQSCNGSFLSSAITVSVIALMAAPAAAQNLPQKISAGDEISFSNTMTVGDTVGGGAWVNETDANWKRGIITAIEVCAGAYVNSITPYYNGLRGTTFGGPGGNCDTWTVPTGQFVQSVEVWSGAWMNKIVFTTNKLEKSPVYGGDGGNRKVWEDPEGGSLRKIDGKFGDYVNGLRLGFTYPYYIENFQYPMLTEPDKLKEFLHPRPPERVDYQEVSACRDTADGYAEQKVTVTVNEKESHSFSFGGSATIGLETEVMVGVPDVASATVRSKAEFSVSFEETNSIEKDYGYSVERPVRAPGGQKKAVITTMKKADVSMPFTYDLVHYKQGNKSRIVSRQPYSGVYSGVRVASVTTDQIAIDCATGKPLISVAEQTAPAPSVQTGGAATAPVSTASIETPAAVTPFTVSQVVTSSGGIFEKGDEGYWHELSEMGDVRFTFEVIDRNEDCIYLLDVARGVLIVLNLARDKVEYAASVDEEPFDLYDITSKS